MHVSVDVTNHQKGESLAPKIGEIWKHFSSSWHMFNLSLGQMSNESHAGLVEYRLVARYHDTCPTQKLRNIYLICITENAGDK